MSVPYQMAGAETMAHRMAKFLISKGHEVTVLQPGEDTVFEGVNIWNNAKSDRVHKLWQDADLVFTHLDRTGHTENASKAYKKKVVHIIHNSHNDSFLRCLLPNQYLVYNSKWVKDKLQYKQESIILNPPVDYRDFEGVNNKNSKYVTLINLNENKGGQILIDIAKKMPDTQFLGIEGGYYDQIKDTTLTNIKYVPQTKDIKKYLKDTKILIVPSKYESWGQVAIEAASMGIPVIASNNEGLNSSLSDSGIFVERNDIDSWVKEIKNLENTKVYKSQSDKVYERALELDPLPQLEKFEDWLKSVNQKPYLR